MVPAEPSPRTRLLSTCMRPMVKMPSASSLRCRTIEEREPPPPPLPAVSVLAALTLLSPRLPPEASSSLCSPEDKEGSVPRELLPWSARRERSSSSRSFSSRGAGPSMAATPGPSTSFGAAPPSRSAAAFSAAPIARRLFFFLGWCAGEVSVSVSADGVAAIASSAAGGCCSASCLAGRLDLHRPSIHASQTIARTEATAPAMAACSRAAPGREAWPGRAALPELSLPHSVSRRLEGSMEM
mmetsp:Transcript_7719/g.21966  ORF Transcript_7719/g.21966 Transcript_7719/m.21966 type:complete len:241 (-) Transcript_7719:1496-2218(-)